MTAPGKLPIASVSELLYQVKNIVNETFDFVAVRGAITNFSASASGHYYFSLSENSSLINAVMFRSSAIRFPIMNKLKDGDQIECVAEVTVYEKRGTIQLVVRQIRLAGEAGLKMEFERIKKKLESLGLFSLDRKKRIPQIPKKIGVITAPKSAAVQDFVNIVKRRGRVLDVVVVPSAVQGDQAAGQVISGLEKILEYNKLNAEDKIEVVVICRGGGSLEDLWAFNNEKLCLKVSDYPLPVVSAIGHQTDFSILDFVSDLRVETPSAAAELLTQKNFELLNHLNNLKKQLSSSTLMHIQRYRLRLEKRAPHKLKQILLNLVLSYKRKLDGMSLLKRPEKYLKIYDYQIQLDSFRSSLSRFTEINLLKLTEKLKHLESNLRVLNPNSVMDRGYAIIKDRNENVIAELSQLKTNELTINFKDGKIDVKKI